MKSECDDCDIEEHVKCSLSARRACRWSFTEWANAAHDQRNLRKRVGDLLSNSAARLLNRSWATWLDHIDTARYKRDMLRGAVAHLKKLRTCQVFDAWKMLTIDLGNLRRSLHSLWVAVARGHLRRVLFGWADAAWWNKRLTAGAAAADSFYRSHRSAAVRSEPCGHASFLSHAWVLLSHALFLSDQVV